MELNEIIDRIREGESREFARLVRRYRDMAFGYALTLLDQEQMAEDAVQEAFVVAYTHLNRLQQPQAFGAWLRGIVRNQCYRERRNAPHALSWEQMTETAGEEADPASRALDRAILAQVQAAIAELPNAQRQVIQWHYDAGLSQKEIATRLDLPISTVNMRLHAARARLRRRLFMMDNQTSPANIPGRVQKADGPVVTLQFAPHAVPPLFSLLLAEGKDTLCIIQHLSAGRVRAIASRAEAIWTPGQEMTAPGQPYTGTFDSATVQRIVDAYRSLRPTPQHLASNSHLESGIKSIELFAPLTQGGITGICTEWGLGVLVLLPELMHHLDREENQQTFFVFLPPIRDAQHWQEVTREITVASSNITICYVPVADPIAPAFVASLQSLEATLVLSRRLAEQAIWPCIEPLYSRSLRLEQNTAGSEQAMLADGIRQLLCDYYDLQFSPGETGRHTLSPTEQQRIQRARKALRLLSQPFFVAEPYTGKPGVFVSSEETVQGFANIMAGHYDSTSKDAFYMVGPAP